MASDNTPQSIGPVIFGDEEHVLVPRGILGAACSVIDQKRDGTIILTELRRYTFGDLSAATRNPALASDVFRELNVELGKAFDADPASAVRAHAAVLPIIQRLAALSAAAPAVAPFQQRVQPWMMECFGPMIAGDREERNHRFLEEALELVQATGCSASEAHQLVDYVFGRPVGEPAQEVGGVMVTLAALCLANGLDMHTAAETELARIWTKVESIRAKQAAKPKHSPLPEHAAPTVPQAGAPARNLDSAALVSMRHLLVTDPKAHADTVIQVIDTMLAQAEAPAVKMFNPCNGSPETALQMAAVIALRDAEPQAGAESYPLSGETECDLYYASRVLEAIANRAQQVGDVIEPVSDIRHAQRLAKVAFRRISRAITSIDSTAALRARGAVPSGLHAVLRYERNTPGKENEMPRVVSCNWLPDGEYPVYLAPAAPMSAQPSDNEIREAAADFREHPHFDQVGFAREVLARWGDAPVPSDCQRCSGSGEDPEGFYDQSRGPDGDTHEGPCRTCGGSGAPQPPAALPGEQDARDAAFEAVRQRLCKVPRYSFALDGRGNVRRCEDKSGNWIEFDAAHELFDPVAVDSAMAAKGRTDGGEPA